MIEADKTAVMTVREADTPVNNARQIHTMPMSCGSVLRLPVVDSKAADKYQKLCNIEIE